jgi:hypothetical protein
VHDSLFTDAKAINSDAKVASLAAGTKLDVIFMETS